MSLLKTLITGSLSPVVTQLYHTLSIVHKGNDYTTATRQTAADKVRRKVSIFLMST